MRATALSVATGLLSVTACRALESPDRETAGGVSGPADHVWVGPMPFVRERTVRPDYLKTLTTHEAWSTVLRHTDVLKSYLMVLPNVPVPGRSQPEISDDGLRRLAAFNRTHKLKMAFEVGGLRLAEGEKARQGAWGKAVAANEWHHLKRWLDAGGRIDYLTTDHAVMMNLGHRCTKGTDCGLALPDVLDELADYFACMAARIPHVRFGVIESLGFFHVTGPDGHEYPRTVPQLPVWHFETYFDELLAAMQRRGLTLDHFHIDFGYMGVAHDGGSGPGGRLDFGRVLGVERYVRSKGVKCGLIVNAFHEGAQESPDAGLASQQAYTRTRKLVDDYVAAGGQADQWVLQTWHPYPDHTGPEDTPYTVLNIARDIVLSEAFKTWLARADGTLGGNLGP